MTGSTQRLPWSSRVVLLTLLPWVAGSAMAQEASAPTPPVPPAGDAHLNVILVAMDTTRADHLGTYGYSRDTSPNLDRLAREAVVFERCYSQANETLTSFASTFTSRLPSEIASLSYERFHIPEDASTLPSVLQLHGFQTGGFVAGGHLVDEFGHAKGFDTYQDGWHFGSFHHTVPPALAWLDQRDRERPFFLFVHGYDAHTPYRKPLYFEGLFDPDYTGIADDILDSDTAIDVEKVWQGRFYKGIRWHQVARAVGERDIQVLHTDLFSLLALQDPAQGQALTQRDLDHFVAHYDGSIAYADLQLGLLMAELRERGLLDTSVVVIMGDHGEDLFEHGHANHRISLHDASGHVPLIIRLPGGAHGGQRISTPVDLLDLMPTLLELNGVTAPAGTRGRSLTKLLDEGRDPQRSATTVSEGILPMASVRGDSLRLIVSGTLPGSPEFMQLLNGAPLDDPAFALFRVGPELEQRLDLHDPAVRELAQPLLEALRETYAHHARLDQDQVPYLDPALLQIMQDKGYW